MYGELIIGVNMLFNFAILSFANNVGSIHATRKRLLFASFIGAIPVVFYPSSLLAICISFVCMTLVAFGMTFEPWKKSAIMVAIGAVFAGGLLTALQLRNLSFGSIYTILLYAIIAYLALFFMKRKWLDVRIVKNMSSLKAASILHIWDAEIAVEVFVDSGNSCTEPLSGAPVHFVSFKEVEKYLPDNIREPLMAWDSASIPDLSSFPRDYQKDLRLIRLFTVQGQSWAVGFKFDKWEIKGGGKLQQGYIVLTKENRRYPEGAGAILHMSAMEIIIEERGIIHAT